ncbi:hypothetical protein COL26b_007675 [Colletotrichum chrysophilum]|uniref:uncharacterized protein n=1 Tax=Colletotrichum chrysophilum TaxID=1836956 RepID=UPI0022FFDD6E|nr:uncharacterized protein COL26b_007675 [Colletotrichum chrysophilum]KAJ0374120.1 hypothetical protein COL26b_007675 [Colletotrichum chrysophilum]
MSTPRSPRSPYRQTYRESVSRRRESNNLVIPEKARTSGISGNDQDSLPVYNNATPHRRPPPRSKVRVKPSGESGRKGFHPMKFLKITWKSSSRASLVCNFFWPVVPAAFAVRYTLPNEHVLIFVLVYISMIPCANMVGFAGQELARKVNHVFGVLMETTGVALAIPTIFDRSLQGVLTVEEIDKKTLHISRIVSLILIVSYLVYVYFQARTHHGIYDAIFKNDEQRDNDKHRDIRKAKLTLTECIIALVVALTLVTFMAIFLVEQIAPIVEEHSISDPFMGLILVPLVEKAAEHLTAVDEAWDNQMNFALSHVLGATLQTALLNAPLVTIVAWGRHKHFDLVFEAFDITMLILAIITVGNFLRDGKSNYLEGFLLLAVYTALGTAAWFYVRMPSKSSPVDLVLIPAQPNPPGHGTGAARGASEGLVHYVTEGFVR